MLLMAVALLAPSFRPQHREQTTLKQQPKPPATPQREASPLWPEIAPLHVVGGSVLADANEFLAASFVTDEAAPADSADPVAPAAAVLPTALPANGADHYYLRFMAPVDPRRFRYKLDPAFGVENGQVQLKGLILRLRLRF